MKKYIYLIISAFLTLTQSAWAQGESMTAKVMRENGKIYVVVGVLVIIFIGIVVYLIALDRRISKIEKQNK